MKTTGSLTRTSSSRSATSRLTMELLTLLSSFSMVVKDSSVSRPDRHNWLASSSEQNDAVDPVSRNA